MNRIAAVPLVIAPHLTVSRVIANYLTVSRLISEVQGTLSYISYLLLSQVMACYLQVSWATTYYLAGVLIRKCPGSYFFPYDVPGHRIVPRHFSGHGLRNYDSRHQVGSVLKGLLTDAASFYDLELDNALGYGLHPAIPDHALLPGGLLGCHIPLPLPGL
jgi:hypothetical protein